MRISIHSGELLSGPAGAKADLFFRLFVGQSAGLADANIICLIVAVDFLGYMAILLVGIASDRPEAYCLIFPWI